LVVVNKQVGCHTLLATLLVTHHLQTHQFTCVGDKHSSCTTTQMSDMTSCHYTCAVVNWYVSLWCYFL